MSGVDWTRAVEVLARAHLHFLWQGTLVALVLGAALALVPLRRARLRYGLSCLALLAAAAWPCATAASHARSASGVAPYPAVAVPAASPGAEGLARSASTGARGAAAPRAGSSSLRAAQPWIVAAWLLGVAWLSARNLRAWRTVRALERAGTEPAPAHWRQRFAGLCRAMGLGRTVRLLASTRVDGPVALGWLRPVVLVPAGAFTGLSPAELEAVLAHELAHVRRHDYLVNLLQVGVETLLFYHPAVWWISRRVRIAREHCCDDVAVAVCGDGVTYASALTRLEEGRAASAPALAVPAADGGLVARVRRVLRREGPHDTVKPHDNESPHDSETRRTQGVGAMIAISIALTAACYLSAAAPASAQDGASRRPLEPTSAAVPADGRGLWLGRLEGDRLRLDLRPAEKQDSWWSLRVELPSEQLSALTLGDDVTLTLTREAGTFTFTGDLVGSMDGADGTGRYTLAANPDYVRMLEGHGYRDLSGHDLFRLATLDVTRAWVDGLAELGYRVSFDVLMKMATHDVTPEYVRGLQAAGYAGLQPEELIKAAIHDVTPGYAREMLALAPEGLPMRDLIGYAIHDVTPAYAREMRGLGYPDVGLETLRKMRIHDVTPAYIRGIETGLGERVPLDELIGMSIHGVDEPFIADMRARFGELDADHCVKMRIHGVSQPWLDELAELGYGELTVDQAVKMRIHGVGPDYVRKLQAEGEVGLSVEELVGHKIHGGHRHRHQ